MILKHYPHITAMYHDMTIPQNKAFYTEILRQQKKKFVFIFLLLFYW